MATLKNRPKKFVLLVFPVLFFFLHTAAHDSALFKPVTNLFTPSPGLVQKQSPKFWVVNFGSSATLAPGKFAFAAGLGGQMVFVGEPRKTNAFFMIPHAGFRVGVAKNLDAGLRLAPIPLPYATAGPGFGMNLDVKYCFTPPAKKVLFAADAGIGISHVIIQENTRFAWSYNAALFNTYNLNSKTALTIMGRYVNIQIPTAPKGSGENFVNIAGTSLGLRRFISEKISILPEVGVYWYDGKLLSAKTSGPGFQYGFMIGTTL